MVLTNGFCVSAFQSGLGPERHKQQITGRNQRGRGSPNPMLIHFYSRSKVHRLRFVNIESSELPISAYLIQWVWRGACDCVGLESSLVMRSCWNLWEPLSQRSHWQLATELLKSLYWALNVNFNLAGSQYQVFIQILIYLYFWSHTEIKGTPSKAEVGLIQSMAGLQENDGSPQQREFCSGLPLQLNWNSSLISTQSTMQTVDLLNL